MKLSFYVVDGGFAMSAGTWISDKRVAKMEDADVVVFTGGADINPALYGEKRHPLTFSHGPRDQHEVEEFKKARALNKPLVGICRGAQLLCAMAGGKLVQHMQGSPGGHYCINCYENGPLTYKVTSCHHQAQYPWNLEPEFWRLLGVTTDESDVHENAERNEMVLGMGPAFMDKFPELVDYKIINDDLPEVEDAYYRNINALAIQSHPEWLDAMSPTLDHYRRLVELMVNKKL